MPEQLTNTEPVAIALQSGRDETPRVDSRELAQRLGVKHKNTIELLDTAEKPGAKGRVIDINLLYTTLEDFNSPSGQSLLQIPNALVFQRVLRRWREGDPGAPVAPSAAPAPAKLPRPYQVRAQHK